MKCPNCNNKVKISDKFCKYCANPLNEYKADKFKNIIRITAIVFFALFLFELGYNMIYEKVQQRPFITDVKIGDTDVHVDMNIKNQESNGFHWLKPKEVTVSLLLNEKIENWQIEELKSDYATASLQALNRHNYLDITSEQTELKPGEKLKYVFNISDSNIVKYVRLKKAFKQAKISLSSSECLSPDTSVRKKAKEEYLAKKERERKARERQAAIERERQQYLRQLQQSYYDYDYGYNYDY